MPRDPVPAAFSRRGDPASPRLRPTGQGIVIALASASPRRHTLIGLAGWSVLARPTTVDEAPAPGESGPALTRRLARAKALAATADDGEVVLAADTTVVDGERLLGKPADAAEARQMLAGLRDRIHRVVTTVAIRTPDGRLTDDTCESVVPMRAYSDAEIETYIALGGPFDKAGGYGIQDGVFEPVDMSRFRECFANVMGLPLCHVVRTMRRVGIEAKSDIPAACIAHTGYACGIYPMILDSSQ